jgi:uncharacterized protein YjiS (DUF1127 family)
MTTATLPRLTLTPSLPARLIHAFGLMVDGVLEAREIATRYERLSGMSNAELAGLGLTRSDIPGAAVNGVAGL